MILIKKKLKYISYDLFFHFAKSKINFSIGKVEF